MSRSSDDELLRAFATTRCDQAFSELVRRHLDLVHSVAARVVRNASDARDLAQEVFARLAQQQGRLPSGVPLAAWLHRTTRSAAANFVRSEERRRKRQAAAADLDAMNEEPTWQELEPHLDPLIDLLPKSDRAALVLRFYSEKTHAQIGAQLAISEEAARKRVTRALDKLRTHLSRRGVKATTAFLAATLPSLATTPAPAGLASSISTSALSTSAASLATTSTVTGIIAMTSTAKTYLAVACAITLTGVATYVATSNSSNRSSSNAGSQSSSARPDIEDSSPKTDSPLPGKSPRSERSSSSKINSNEPPLGIDNATWQQAGSFLAMLDLATPAQLLPAKIAPSDKVLATMKAQANLSEKSMESISAAAKAYRTGLEEEVGQAIAHLKSKKDLIQESMALDLVEAKSELTPEQETRKDELEDLLAEEMEAKFSMLTDSKRWYKNEELVTSMKKDLAESEAQAFDLFVEERRSIEIEGWAFNRSQKLAQELHLKPAQRQAVFDELIASKAENSNRVGAILDQQQRTSYEKLPPEPAATMGVGINFFSSGPAPKP